MIEIRIPKEIKNYREKLFFGLTLRQSICTAIALLICVPIYIFGNRFLPQEAISWVVILIAVPLMFTGFFRYNDMAFEQFVYELEHFPCVELPEMVVVENKPKGKMLDCKECPFYDNCTEKDHKLCIVKVYYDEIR